MALDAPAPVENIVVPLDGSKFSERALPVAAMLADRLDVGIYLFGAVASREDTRRREVEFDAAAAVLDAPGRRIDGSVVVASDPAGAIHDTLRRLNGAVACMASPGRGRSAALVGSVATEVVARGHDPLILCGPLIGDQPHGTGVVVCVDETPESGELIGIGLYWAGLLLCEPTTVIVVAEPVPPPTRGPVRRLSVLTVIPRPT
jgi:nucleotide-binding universal stress UspA family protein